MSRGSLDTISMIDTTFPCLCVHVKILQVIVEIHRSGAEISPQERGMCSKYCSDIDSPLFGQWKSYTSQPFVKMGNNCLLSLVGDKLPENSLVEPLFNNSNFLDSPRQGTKRPSNRKQQLHLSHRPQEGKGSQLYSKDLPSTHPTSDSPSLYQ